MVNHIVLIHGRSFKPEKPELKRNWLSALRFGIARDDSSGHAVAAFDDAKKTFVYYGDLSGEFLRGRGKRYDEARDIADRKKTLAALEEVPQRGFTEKRYNQIPSSPLLAAMRPYSIAPPTWRALSACKYNSSARQKNWPQQKFA